VITKKFIFIVVLFCVLANVSAQELLHGKVVNVADGDTVNVLVQGQAIKVRLWGIDAPEYKQPWGRQSAKALKSKIIHKQVDLKIIDTDKYNRKVAVIYLDEADLNQWMVQTGNAWVYRYYNKDKYYNDEHSAKKQKLGLWNLPKNERTPPWQWRRQQ
jgi:micrococcal nuclease